MAIFTQKNHPWIGHPIRELDISRQTWSIMVRRGDQNHIPTGSFVMEIGDMVVLYTKKILRDSVKIDL